MRVLVVAIGTYGDVLPFVGIAAEMRRRGHDVTLASARRFESAARRADVPFETVMSDAQYADVFEHPAFWRPLRGAFRLFRAMPDFLAPVFDFIERGQRPGDTVVVASHLALGARVAEEALGTPTVSVHLTPIMLVSRHVGPKTPVLGGPSWLPTAVKWRMQTGVYTHFIGPLLLPGLNAFRALKGLPPKKRVRNWWHPKRRMILLFADWFAPEQPDWPRQARQIDFPRADLFGAANAELDPALDDFLGSGEPPVAVTFGSAREKSDRQLGAAIAACARLGRRCLVLSQQPPDASAASRNENVFFSGYAPLSAVLPRCAALVHHGGIGTVALALKSGTPQLVAPFAFDQFDHAARIERLGCGSSIRRSLFSERRVAKALKRLLDSPDVADSCRRVAEVFGDDDAIARACDEIEAEFAPAKAATEPVAVRAPAAQPHSLA